MPVKNFNVCLYYTSTYIILIIDRYVMYGICCGLKLNNNYSEKISVMLEEKCFNLFVRKINMHIFVLLRKKKRHIVDSILEY